MIEPPNPHAHQHSAPRVGRLVVALRAGS